MFLNISVTYKFSLVKFLLVSIFVATPYDSSDMPSYMVRDTAWKLDVVEDSSSKHELYVENDQLFRD